MTIESRADDGRAHEQSIVTRIFELNRQLWTVQEVSDATTANRSLVFSSLGIARRIRSYPDNWRELPDARLYALSWER